MPHKPGDLILIPGVHNRREWTPLPSDLLVIAFPHLHMHTTYIQTQTIMIIFNKMKNFKRPAWNGSREKEGRR